jgi:chorismate dehydratase
MCALRISIVEFLNTAPLVHGFVEGPLRGKYELEFAVPSQCAESLRSNTADIGIIPAIEFQRMSEGIVFPDMAVAAKREVRSILVLAKKPIEKAQRIALDTSSRSSQALVRILCKRLWRIAPEFVDAKPHVATMLGSADAALLIGDPALRISLAVEGATQSQAKGAPCCQAVEDILPICGVDSLYVYDVAAEWRRLTGLPCVLAIWVARSPEAARAEVVEDFLASKEFGLARIAEIAEGASHKLALPARALESYLRDNIDFSLDEENRAGLDLYFRYCAEDGLIPAARPVQFAETGKRVRV